MPNLPSSSLAAALAESAVPSTESFTTTTIYLILECEEDEFDEAKPPRQKGMHHLTEV
jgi:hypothetical protein